MKIAIVGKGGWQGYVGEILKLEGLGFFEEVEAEDISRLEADVAVLSPGYEPEGVEDFLSAGGGLVCFRPGTDILRLAGLEDAGPKPGALRLRLTGGLALAGLGTDLPVLGPAATYPDNEETPVAGYLLVETEYGSPSLGLIETKVGKGRLFVFAYDLPECVARIRQGEPERSGALSEGDSVPRGGDLYAMALPGDAGWVPYADLHCMLLGDILRALLPGPAPSFWRLPGDAPGLVVFSGDDDAATPEMVEWEMRDVEAMGGRMSVYLMPGQSKSSPEHARRWRERGHEASVHPNVVDKTPDLVAMRAKLREEIRDFKNNWGGEVKTLRMHCLAWPGYVEPAEILAEMDVRMECNFFSVPVYRNRARAPYYGVGAAMPMPFAGADGSLVQVWQQPGHLEDDALFGKINAYSQKLSPEAWEIILGRIFDNIGRYFHCVYCANVHPVNYLRFSGEQARELMRAAVERGFPILSMEQWLDFWQTRDAWRLSDVSWGEGMLSFSASGPASEQRLSVAVPALAGGPIDSVEVNGLAAPATVHRRFLRETCFVPIAPGSERVNIVIKYRTGG